MSGICRRLISSTPPTINGVGSTAMILGGFGFGERQMAKHAALYDQHGFGVLPVLSSISQLTTPSGFQERGAALAVQLQERDQLTVIHSISGSFWTMVYMLDNLDPEWRDANIKAIVYDSCPPRSDVLAFGGWLSFALKCPWIKRYVAPLFHPYRWYAGITCEWEAENHAKMFGGSAVLPRSAHSLFMHGRNDPVLDVDYLETFIEDVHEHAALGACCQQVTFEKARHAMAVVENPDEYKALHVEHLLGKVAEWGGETRREDFLSRRPVVMVQ